MDETIHLLVMGLDTFRFAFPLESVDRVYRAAEVTPLPEAPSTVLGIINIRGKVAVVINLRKRCRLPERPIEPADQFVVVLTPRRPVALVVDQTAVMQYSAQTIMPADDVLPGTDFVRGVIKRDDGLTLVCDLSALLSIDDERILSSAMEAMTDSQ